MAIYGSAPITIYKPDGTVQDKIYGKVNWWTYGIGANRDYKITVNFEFWKASGTTASDGLNLKGNYSINLWGGNSSNSFNLGSNFTIPGGGTHVNVGEVSYGGVLPSNASNIVRIKSLNAVVTGSTVIKNISFDFTADMTLPAGFGGNVANFTDEQYASINIPINNPSGLSCTIYVDYSTGGRTFTTSQKSGNFRVPFTSSDRDNWCKLNPTKNTVPFKFRITSTVPGLETTYQEKSAVMTIVNAYPVFNNFRCYDSNSKTAALLDNDENVFINNQSNMKVDISAANKMLFKKGATGTNAKYIANFETLTKSVNYSATATVSMDFAKVVLPESSIGKSVVVVTAYDSRGEAAGTSKLVTIISWKNPNPVLKIERTSMFASSVNVKINSGTFSPVKYKNTNRNNIKMARFSYKEKSASSYSSPVAFTITQSSGNATFYSDTKTLSGFDISKEYDFKIEVQDQFVTYTKVFTLPKGKPNCFIGINDSKSIITVGKIPDFSLPNGSIDVTGGYYVNGKALGGEKGNANISLKTIDSQVGYSSKASRYYIIGNVCFVQFYFGFNGTAPSSGYTLDLDKLPITPASVNTFVHHIYCTNLKTPYPSPQSGCLRQSGTSFRMYASNGTSRDMYAINTTWLQDGTTLSGSFWYMI